ncbi:MAG: arabinosyltransferase domain-containing protein [Actinomycetota bacterium]|nr:arabinosyltransferase domain-containing protein [Actinomycetota bacterium]
MFRTENTAAAPSSARVRVAQALGLVALIASLLGALGPAERVRTTYSWPPAALPSETPTTAWYAPLLLIQHEPEMISADISCRLPPALSSGQKEHVLSTARYPERVGGLTLTQSETQLVVTLGRIILDRVDLPPGGGSDDCAHRVTIAGGRWFVSGNGIERQGVVEAMPTVNGLFSGLDLAAGRPLDVTVTTLPHATRASTRQTIAWIVAAFAVVGALYLVAFERRPGRRSRALRHCARAVIAHAHPADLVVAAVLLVWSVIAPVNFDDGWVIQREQMFETSKGFSAYYSLLAANMPLDYWLEWLHHWLAEASNALIVYRLAVLVVLMAVWSLCRWIVTQLPKKDREAKVGIWILASAFLLGSMAWGMTLRPEPVTALFVTGVTACMIRFLRREDSASIAVASALVALALTAHPTGVVSLAPILVAAPKLYRWARAQLAPAVTIVSASSALLATLAFVGADLDQRVADADTTQELAGNSRDEIQRYAFLWEEPFGTPLRRAFVALLLLAVLAFVLGRRRVRSGLLEFPVSVLAIGLVLLVATPSKWPSHFGALIGVGTLAISIEAARLRSEGRSTVAWRTWPLLAIGAATLATTWSWWEREPWNALDLRTLDWRASLGLSQLAVLLPVLLLATLSVIFLARGRRSELHRSPWLVASWIPPVVALPAILFTVGVLIVDAAKTSSWTVARQNLESIAGGAGCGLADDVLISRDESARALDSVGAQPRFSLPDWVPPAPVAGLPRFALGPTRNTASYSPWFERPASGRAGLFVTGTPGLSDTLRLEWGRSEGARIERLGSADITEVVSEPSGNAPWRFFAAGDLPSPHPRATIARVEYRPGVQPGNAVAASALVTYANERLAPLMSAGASRTLVYPELYLYFPCRKVPQLQNGAVGIPQFVVIGQTVSPPLRYHVTSPFVGLLDLYELERVPVADSEESVDRLRVFAVEARIPGAALAPPTTTDVVS